MADAPAQIDAGLRQLAVQGLLRSDDDGGSFAHPLLQEVAYRTQLESRRRLVHAELARLLAQRHCAMEPASELSLRIPQHGRGPGDPGHARLAVSVAARGACVLNDVPAIAPCR